MSIEKLFQKTAFQSLFRIRQPPNTGHIASGFCTDVFHCVGTTTVIDSSLVTVQNLIALLGKNIHL